jgi:hypothetical protein
MACDIKDLDMFDALPSSLMDSNVNLKLKQWKSKELDARSLAHSISRVEGWVELWDGTRKMGKQFIFSHKLAQTKQ